MASRCVVCVVVCDVRFAVVLVRAVAVVVSVVPGAHPNRQLLHVLILPRAARSDRSSLLVCDGCVVSRVCVVLVSRFRSGIV